MLEMDCFGCETSLVVSAKPQTPICAENVQRMLHDIVLFFESVL